MHSNTQIHTGINTRKLTHASVLTQTRTQHTYNTITAAWTQAKTHTHKTLIHIHTQTNKSTLLDWHKPTKLTQKYTHTHFHAHVQTQAQTNKWTPVHTCSVTHTNTYNQTQTHTDTHIWCVAFCSLKCMRLFKAPMTMLPSAAGGCGGVRACLRHQPVEMPPQLPDKRAHTRAPWQISKNDFH